MNRTGRWKFSCVNGTNECFGNALQSCLFHYYPNTSQHLPFVNCMESHQDIDVHFQAIKCSKAYKVSYQQLKTCADGAQGNQLEHEMAVKTQTANRTSSQLPWFEKRDNLISRNPKFTINITLKTFKGDIKRRE